MNASKPNQRRVDNPKNNAPSLLLLPTSDLHTNQGISRQNERLVLMEIPKGASVDQLFANGARIMSAGSTNPARLVTESNGSFDMVKVETSNCLVLVPPLDQDGLSKDEEDDVSSDASSSKRARQSLVKMPSRKINSSFIELQKTYLDRSELYQMLLKCVFDPFDECSVEALDNGKVGWTISDLVHELRVSDKEIIDALQERCAFRISIRNNDSIEYKFCLLSEESLKEAFDALLAAFIEDDIDFKNCEIDSCIESATKLLGQGNAYNTPMHDPSQIIKHCLHVVSEGPFQYDNFGTKSVTSLDIDKIAVFLAHQLFNSKSDPWTHASFIDEWNRLMPGVGDEFLPSLTLLKGIALQYKDTSKSNESTKTEYFLRYLPENKLPMNIMKRFEILFQIQDQWKLEELEPYITPLITGTNITLSEVLLKYTRVIVGDNGEKSYQKR